MDGIIWELPAECVMQMHQIPKDSTVDIPKDATQLSKALTKLASPLANAGIHMARTQSKKFRSLSITRRQVNNIW